jgi:hypothetical protein
MKEGKLFEELQDYRFQKRIIFFEVNACIYTQAV